MDVAIVLNARRHGKGVANLSLRPFADSSLGEIALDKLAHLDAPVRKYVAVGDRETKQLASRYGLLKVIRDAHPEEANDFGDLSRTFAHLGGLPESHFLAINPCFPLVTSDVWWQAVEDFLAADAHGLVSAHRCQGPFYDDQGQRLEATNQLYCRNDAFALFGRELLREGEADFFNRAQPFVLAPESAWGINEADDLAAVEAVYTMSRIGVLV